MPRSPQPLAETTSLTFPLTTDYCSNWSLSKALIEVVSNGFDESDQVDLRWQDSFLEIEDHGQGLPRQGLLLGFSSKRGNGQKIGQFGEGLNLALLVAARTKAKLLVDTVGYQVTPKAIFDPNLDAEVLQINFAPSTRQSGTLVRCAATQAQAEAIRAHFLRFQPGYRLPKSPGRIIPNHPGGAVYLGGVMVRANAQNFFSYDLCLADAKPGINRDRTFLEDRVLDRQIEAIIAAVNDPQLIAQLLLAASHDSSSSKPQVADRELRFLDNNPHKLRFLTERVRPLLFDDQLVAVADNDTDANANAEYQGYHLLAKAGRHMWQLRAIFKSMGIPAASQVAKGKLNRRERFRQERVKAVVWAKPQDITTEHQANLDAAIAAVTGLLGPDAIGTIKVFKSTSKERLCAASGRSGFYSPHDGSISLNLETLLDQHETLSTLVHEVGHRLAHHGPFHRSDYGDRAHGFESALESIATSAIERLAHANLSGETLPLTTNALAHPTSISYPLRIRYQVASLMTKRMRRLGLNYTSLAKASYISVNTTKAILYDANSWRPDRLESIVTALQLDRDLILALSSLYVFGNYATSTLDEHARRNRQGKLLHLPLRMRQAYQQALQNLIIRYPQSADQLQPINDFFIRPITDIRTALFPGYEFMLAELERLSAATGR